MPPPSRPASPASWWSTRASSSVSRVRVSVDIARGTSPARRSSTSTRTSPTRPGLRGRHPLPDPARFQAAARRAGISRDSTVVAYDAAGEGGAARLWWLLRHHGHANVAVLDGGLNAWVEAGGVLSTAVEPVEPGDFEVRPGDLGVVALEEVDGRAAAARRACSRALSRARSSRSTRSPGTSPARSTCRSRASRRTGASWRRTSSRRQARGRRRRERRLLRLGRDGGEPRPRRRGRRV